MLQDTTNGIFILLAPGDSLAISTPIYTDFLRASAVQRHCEVEAFLDGYVWVIVKKG